MLWQPFPSEPVAAPAPLRLLGSLAPSLSLPPFLPSVWAGGGAGRGGGPGQRPGARARSRPRGGAQPRDHLPPALRARPARRRGTHGPRHPPRARPPGSGRAARAPRTEPPARGRRRRPLGADCGSEGGSERWAGAAGRAHGRVHGAYRARRARARQLAEGPHPLSLAAKEAVPGAKGGGPGAHLPHRVSAGGAPVSPCKGNARATPHSSWQQAVRTGHTLADPVHTIVGRAHKMLSQAAETENLIHIHTQLNPESKCTRVQALAIS